MTRARAPSTPSQARYPTRAAGRVSHRSDDENTGKRKKKSKKNGHKIFSSLFPPKIFRSWPRGMLQYARAMGLRRVLFLIFYFLSRGDTLSTPSHVCNGKRSRRSCRSSGLSRWRSGGKGFRQRKEEMALLMGGGCGGTWGREKGIYLYGILIARVQHTSVALTLSQAQRPGSCRGSRKRAILVHSVFPSLPGSSQTEQDLSWNLYAVTACR